MKFTLRQVKISEMDKGFYFLKSATKTMANNNINYLRLDCDSTNNKLSEYYEN